MFSPSRPIHVALLVFLAGTVTTLGVLRWHVARSDLLVAGHFEQVTLDVDKRLHARLSVYENALSATRSGAVLAGVSNVSRASFRRSVQWTELANQFPGAHGLGLIRRVPAADSERFVAAARRDDAPAFGLRQVHPHDGDRYVIQYVEPQAKNESAIGLDIASEPARKRAADDAMFTGRPTMTAPITLVQAKEKPESGFLLLLPIYLPYAPLRSAKERDEATTAWAYVPLLMDDVLDDFRVAEHYSMALRDREAGSHPFFVSHGFGEPASDGVVKLKRLPLYGRTWELELRARPEFIASLNLSPPGAVLGLGLAVSAMLAALSYLYSQATQRRAEVFAEQSRRAAIVGSSSDAVIAETLDGLITDWNPAAERLFGYSADEAVGHSTVSLTVPQELAAEAVEVRAMVARGECPKPFDSVRLAADGRMIDVSITISPIIAANGERVGLSKTIRDISDAKRVEQAAKAHRLELERQVSERTAALASTLAQLQRTTERMALATDGAKIGVWELELVSQTVSWDPWMYRLYGREPVAGALPASTWMEAVHPDDRAAIYAEVAAAQRGEREFDTEFRIVWPSGEQRFIRALARVIRDQHGVASHMTGVNFDITARKQAELNMQALSYLLRNVLEAASEVSLIATDPQLVINVFNRGAEQLLGYEASELIGTATPLVIHDAAELEARARELSAAGGGPVSGGGALIHPLALKAPREWTYIRKDGSRVPVSLVVTEMRSADGEIFGYLGLAHDVTRQKNYETSLKEATRRAEDANRAKSDFLANMSHEIRTPMNAVIGVAYLLARTSLDLEQAELLGKIQVASRALMGLLNDVLDLSKIEAGELSLECAPFALHELLADLRATFALQAEHKGIGFDVRIEAQLPDVLEGDVVRLNQVLANLLTNAYKFTARGRFALQVRCIARQEGRIVLGFDVEDTGIGMTNEQISRLFSPFQQADSSTTRRFGGTGLGLSIVKRLVSLMGGDISVRSQAKKGSCFSVTLPFEVARTSAIYEEPGAREDLGERPLQGMRVLVVDDSDVNQFVAQRILEQAGARVALANNGHEAVDRLALEPRAFDVVLMDLQMPIMDGRAAARCIREQLKLSDLPLVALTADARTSERTGVLDAGMNDFVSKPFDPHTLVRRLRNLVGRGGRNDSDEPGGPLLPAATWPPIGGVDVELAQRRLGNDHGLFVSCLERLVRDFVPLPRPGDAPSRAELETYAKLMHRLRGSAGQVAAEGIRVLAEELEVACRAGEADRVAGLALPLAGQLEQLARSVRGGSSSRAGNNLPVVTGPPDIGELMRQLRSQELGALKELERLAPSLSSWLGDASFRRLVGYVDALAFSEAVQELEASRAAGEARA